MKIIIAGSRTIDDDNLVITAIKNSNFSITEIVSGGAKGIDQCGEKWAQQNGIPVTRFPAQWDDLSQPDALIKTLPNGSRYGAFAGPRRNEQMAEYADALIAIYGRSESPGTDDMLARAQAHNLQVFIFRADLENMSDVEDARQNGEPIMFVARAD